MDREDIVIVGAGIAGLSAARALLGAGARRVRVLEREAAPCLHSSGRNAAIFRHLSLPAGDFELAVESRALLDELCGGEAAWLARTGMWLLASAPAPLAPLAALAERARFPHEEASFAALHEAVPALRGGPITHGIFCAADGVIDIHAVTQALAKAVRGAGGALAFGVEVERVEIDHGRVTGVRLASGDRIAAGTVILAAGAWGATLGAASGAPLPLEPRRRHLVQIETGIHTDPRAPVLWALGDELYLRPESGGLLASPCDTDPWKAELPAPTEAGVELLAHKLARLAPGLAEASVRRAWACLRTFAPDAAAVVGPDPRAEGLAWLAGLGGHGMTGGLAAGEVLAASITGRAHPLAEALAPARIIRR